MSFDIDPGEGYRLLGVGETIEEGDERHDYQEWTPVVASIGDTWGRWLLPVRRKTTLLEGLEVDPDSIVEHAPLAPRLRVVKQANGTFVARIVGENE